MVVVGVADVSDALVSGRSLSVVRDRAPQRFMEQNFKNFRVFKVYTPPGQSSTTFCGAEQETLGDSRPGQGSPAFGGAHHGFLPGSSSTAFYGAEHHGFLPGSSSTAFGGAEHLHHLPPLSSDGGSSGVDGEAEFRPMRFCMYLGSGTCFKGDECTSAHAWEELHPDTPEWGLHEGTSC